MREATVCFAFIFPKYRAPHSRCLSFVLLSECFPTGTSLASVPHGSNTEAAMAQYQLYCFKDHLIFLASSGCQPPSLKLKRDFKNCGYMIQEWFLPLSISYNRNNKSRRKVCQGQLRSWVPQLLENCLDCNFLHSISKQF